MVDVENNHKEHEGHEEASLAFSIFRLRPRNNNLYNFAVGWASARRDSPQTG
jgi:hypothetical protein